MLHYESLWDGVEDKHGNIDNRGPCGCHHGAAYCKFHQKDNPVEWANWLQTMARAHTEADKEYDFLTAETRGRLGNWSGQVEALPKRPPPVLMPKAPPPVLDTMEATVAEILEDPDTVSDQLQSAKASAASAAGEPPARDTASGLPGLTP